LKKHFAEHAEEADDDGEAGHDEETDGDVPDETEYDEAGPGTYLILCYNFNLCYEFINDYSQSDLFYIFYF
jgi:hypothetical protein